MVREAAALQAHQARKEGDEGLRRVRLLQLRFTEGLPIREIARRWEMEPRRVHQLYERARREFKQALLKVVRFHNPDSPSDAKRELSEVLATLGGAVAQEADGYALGGAEKNSSITPGKSGEM
jgi:hypothetical protein